MKRYVCFACNRSFPEEVMYSFSPYGLVRIHECPECHERGINSVDKRNILGKRFVKAKSQERAS